MSSKILRGGNTELVSHEGDRRTVVSRREQGGSSRPVSQWVTWREATSNDTMRCIIALLCLASDFCFSLTLRDNIQRDNLFHVSHRTLFCWQGWLLSVWLLISRPKNHFWSFHWNLYDLRRTAKFFSTLTLLSLVILYPLCSASACWDLLIIEYKRLGRQDCS